MSYSIAFTPQARKEFGALDGQVRERILKALARLAAGPRKASNVKVLSDGGFRLRVGDYRVLYEVQDEIMIVLVLKAAHRREVYRRR